MLLRLLILIFLLVNSCSLFHVNDGRLIHRSLASGNQAYTIEEISEQLSFIQKKLYEKYGVEKLYISGGSARTTLDHLVYGEALSMRDLDIAVAMNREVTPQLASEIGRELESSLLGEFSEKDLRTRPRANPFLEGDAVFNYNAGFGFFWKKGQKITDLTLFHSESDVRLNGVMNVDRVLIPLEHNQTLLERAGAFKNKDPPELIEKGLIDDPTKGYQAWRSRQLSIVDTLGVQNSVENLGLRVIRSYGKLDLEQLSAEDEKVLKTALRNALPDSLFQMTRNLMKLLEDKNKTTEVKMLYEVGFFKKFLPDLHRVIEKKGWTQFDSMWKAAIKNLAENGVQTSLDPILSLLSLTTLDERKKIGKELLKIEGMELLDRFDVFLGKDFSQMQIGYFTGEFAPFHKGHLGVAVTALEKGELDYVFIFPTPHATNSPKTPEFSLEEWNERIKFTELGTQESLGVSVFPDLKLFARKKLKLGYILKRTVQALASGIPPWTHIMGGDSFHRVVSRGLVTSDPRPRIIIERPGIENDDIDDLENVRRIRPDEFRPVSATMAMHKIAAGQKPEELHDDVYKYVLTLERYQETIADLQKEQADLKAAIKQQKPITVKDYFVIDLVENSDGLARTKVFSFDRYISLFDYLETQGNPVVIYAKEGRGLGHWDIKKYEERIKAHGYQNITVQRDITHIPHDQKVRVLHSGKANYGIEGGVLEERALKGERILIFETDDLPLSPLLNIEGVHTFKVQKLGALPKRCSETMKVFLSAM